MKRISRVSDTTIAGINITHPERIVYPDAEITKAEVAHYYAAIAERILADVARRPLSIVRCPDGIGGERFFQRHHTRALGAHVHAVTIAEKSGEAMPYLYIDDERGLLELIQMDTIELHAWGATAAAPDHPDRMIFDLDPPAASHGKGQSRERIKSVPTCGEPDSKVRPPHRQQRPARGRTIRSRSQLGRGERILRASPLLW